MANTKSILSLMLVIFILAASVARGQKTANKAPERPLETSVCKISAEPSAYNNKLVKVRGNVQASSEYSLLVDEHCPGNEIWFAFADGSVPPQVEAFMPGNGIAGGPDSKGKHTQPLSVHLIKDANYLELRKYLEISAKGEACADGPPPALPPDCTTYRVTASFTGRVDGVSKRIHEAHLKRSSHSPVDWKGFGHMGMFDAQIVVQSLENVVAVDDEELRGNPSKPR
jgi:hypothetical protein